MKHSLTCLVITGFFTLAVSGCVSHSLTRIYPEIKYDDSVEVTAQFKSFLYEKDAKRPEGYVFIITEPASYRNQEFRYQLYWNRIIPDKLVIGQNYSLVVQKEKIGSKEYACDYGLIMNDSSKKTANRVAGD